MSFIPPILVLFRAILIATVTFTEALAASSTVPGTRSVGDRDPGASLIRTFHIGNSLTDTVDGWLKPVAESAGRKLDFHRFTIPGAPTDWLWNHPGSGFGDSRYAEAFVALAPIDHLITQPFAGHGRSVENEAKHSGKFYALCREASPTVQLWLYQQWPEQKFKESWSQGSVPLGGDRQTWEKRIAPRPGETFADGGWQGLLLKKVTPPATWQEAVSNHSRYFEILRGEMQRRHPTKPVAVIPGGQALAALKTRIEAGKVPGMTDFFAEIFADGIHLTSKGRYLVALVHYACFWRESPEGRVSPLNSGLAEEQATIFQRIAWEAVRHHQWSGVAPWPPSGVRQDP